MNKTLPIMRQLSPLDRRRLGKPITDSNGAIWLKDRLYPLLMVLTGTKVKYRIETVNEPRPLPGRPIIFAANHSAFPDTPIMLRATGRRSYIFAGKQSLYFVDWLFFVLNGSVWADRRSKEDRAAAKDALLDYLRRGQSILWFPEGTWNLTANQLMMPMKWGIIDVAQQAGAQILPAALDYDRDANLCRVKFGEPMAGAALEKREEAIGTLRDAMATLRWELMSGQPLLSRAEISIEQLKSDMEQAIGEYPPLDWEYEQSCIYRPFPLGGGRRGFCPLEMSNFP